MPRSVSVNERVLLRIRVHSGPVAAAASTAVAAGPAGPHDKYDSAVKAGNRVVIQVQQSAMMLIRRQVPPLS